MLHFDHAARTSAERCAFVLSGIGFLDPAHDDQRVLALHEQVLAVVRFAPIHCKRKPAQAQERRFVRRADDVLRIDEHERNLIQRHAAQLRRLHLCLVVRCGLAVVVREDANLIHCTSALSFVLVLRA